MTADEARTLGQGLLAWYRRSGRRLPWRETRDPFAIWVSEVMLQQTRVETVIPYYHRFLRRFPTVEALAAAATDEVLGQWEGLGYYARALRLHEGARAMVRRGEGLPGSVAAWREVPGVGPYMAAALASFASGAAAPAVDGNVARVMSRVLALPRPRLAASARAVAGAIEAMMAGAGDPAEVNHALMDLGATVCRARAPRCGVCPLASLCRARSGGDPERYPAPEARGRGPVLAVRIHVIRHLGRVLVYRRPPGGILGGLWAFPARFENEGGLAVEIPGVTWRAERQAFRHVFTHQTWQVTARAGDVARPGPAPDPTRWVDAPAVDRLPMGRPDRRVWAWARELGPATVTL